MPDLKKNTGLTYSAKEQHEKRKEKGRTMANKHSARAEKVYVKVNSDFDSTGYIQPKSITWADGRTFKIEKVKDYRPAATFRP